MDMQDPAFKRAAGNEDEFQALVAQVVDERLRAHGLLLDEKANGSGNADGEQDGGYGVEWCACPPAVR